MTGNKLTTTLALVAGLLCSACAASDSPDAGAQARAGRDCFNVGQINGYTTVDRDTVRVSYGASTRYDIDIQGPQCDMVEWAHRLAIEATPSSWICVGRQVGQGNIYFRDSATRQRVKCYIEDVRRVAEAEKPS